MAGHRELRAFNTVLHSPFHHGFIAATLSVYLYNDILLWYMIQRNTNMPGRRYRGQAAIPYENPKGTRPSNELRLYNADPKP
jgi:hypothetical protein